MRFLIKLFHSYVYHSKKFNQWGGSPESHAVSVLSAITYILEIGALLFITIMYVDLGEIRFSSIALIFSIFFVLINFLFWSHIKKKYLSMIHDISGVNVRLYYWGSLLFVILMLMFFLFAPIWLLPG